MAIGHGSGEDRTTEAARAAIESPLLEMSIDGATGVLYNISAGSDLTIFEVNEAAEIIRAAADDEAEIIFGTSIDESLGRDVTITLIATGFQGGRPMRAQRPSQPTAERSDRRSQRVIENSAPSRTPVLPDDEFSEPAILRFLRERQ
jgi:cell division protein FtsZ